jgi:hypothetical protein
MKNAPRAFSVEFFRVHFLDAQKYADVFGTPREEITGIESNLTFSRKTTAGQN